MARSMKVELSEGVRTVEKVASTGAAAAGRTKQTTRQQQDNCAETQTGSSSGRPWGRLRAWSEDSEKTPKKTDTPLSPPRSLAKECTQRRDLFPRTHIWFFNTISLVVPGKDPAGKNQWFLISRQVANQPWKRSRH